MRCCLLIFVILLLSCKEPPPQKPVKKETKRVKVAAIQCYSRMGELDYNFKLLKNLISEAAQKNAKIVVLPEAAVTGYMDPARQITWTAGKPGEGELAADKAAQEVDSPLINKYLELAKKLKIYLTIPFVEVHQGAYFNSVILASPQGKNILHHRKKSLWTHGDSGWCTEGDLTPKAVESEYGKIGLMICYDVHSMPKILKGLKADIVLYSVGWYGPNTEDWYKRRFPEKYVTPNGFSVVAANWSSESDEHNWPGAGWSNIVYKNGIVISITSNETGNEVVYASLPVD